jgi:hypothetical protein
MPSQTIAGHVFVSAPDGDVVMSAGFFDMAIHAAKLIKMCDPLVGLNALWRSDE